ncbi:AMP-binding protein [Benzoatithermus flavus]|uniref:AMP-binding protein n=1 Tax=Benzoatithermus flavus TaxID=3108223 RepID=A0ABU8XQP8_9PROT
MLSSRVLRSILHAILRILYRYEVRGMEHTAIIRPGEKVLVVVNHISFLDGAFLMAALPRIPVFAINTDMANRWWLKPFWRVANLHPLDPTNPLAVKELINKINQGRPCVIFPEGRISVTGALMKIYAGPAYIADRTGAAIIPVRLDGPELTPFSRLKQGQVTRHLFPKVIVTICEPCRLEVGPGLRGKERRKAANLQLYEIMSTMVFRTTHWGDTLFEALLRARSRHGWRYVAVQDTSGIQIDYMRLVAGAMVLGRKLAAETRPGERVGVLLPNVNAAAVVFMALQAMGRVPAMLNFSAGPANLEAAAVMAELGLVVSSAEFVRKGKLEPVVAAIGSHARLLWLEEVRETIGRMDRLRGFVEGLLARKIHGRLRLKRDDPAAVLFTSGSEGRPKGVVLSHRNILANCAQLSARVDFNQLDRCFNALPIFHSFGLTGGMLLPILGGVRVYMYPSPLHYRLVPEMVYDSDSTIIFGTNAFFKGYARMADPYDFRSLRYAFAGGEAVQEETQRLWFEKFGIRILTGYGATETAPVIAVNTPMHYRAGTVGRFLPGIEWRLEPVAGLERGGRLWVKGPNVMLGYLRYERPGVLQPPEDGWYDTGDIVDVDKDGFVSIIGRAKRFAKIGGEMVSLGAIEDLVVSLRPEGHHAVIALPDPRKGERLVLVTNDETLERSEILAAARKKGMSEITVPAEIVRMPKLPVLGTGKTDYPEVQKIVTSYLSAA